VAQLEKVVGEKQSKRLQGFGYDQRQQVAGVPVIWQ